MFLMRTQPADGHCTSMKSIANTSSFTPPVSNAVIAGAMVAAVVASGKKEKYVDDEATPT